MYVSWNEWDYLLSCPACLSSSPTASAAPASGPLNFLWLLLQFCYKLGEACLLLAFWDQIKCPGPLVRELFSPILLQATAPDPIQEGLTAALLH